MDKQQKHKPSPMINVVRLKDRDIPDDIKERHQSSLLWMADSFFLDMGYCCNQSCRYCWTDKTHGFKSLAYFESCLKLAELRNFTKPMLIGGEPLIFDAFDELVELFHEHGMKRFGVNTNGTRLADAAFFDKLCEQGMYFCQISFDSSNPRTQNDLARHPELFRKLEKALENVARHPEIEFHTSTVVTTRNIDDLQALAEYFLRFQDRTGIIVHMGITAMKPTPNADKGLVPRLTQTASKVGAVIEYGEKHELFAQYREIPFCLMPNLERQSTEYWFDVYEHKQGRMPVNIAKYIHKHADACENCLMNQDCSGISIEYAKVFGSDELRPLL